MTPDQIVMQKAIELEESIPALLIKSEGLRELFIANDIGLIPSLSTVLLQEMAKFNRLLKIMKTSLAEIQLAIEGFIVMSEVLDKMYLKMQNNQVPDNWSKIAYPSLKPLSSWFKDLIDRVDFMRNWLMTGNPSSYWVPGMFFPQGFMTGVLQTHARKHTIAIDKLAFSFNIMEQEGVEDIDEAPEDGVFVYGLFMDGARYDRENACIADQFPTIMFDKMPVIQFAPVVDYKPDPEQYHAPLYKTSVRAGVLSTTGQSTNFIVHVACPSQENPSLWVQRAAAMLCMLND
jgi:dynein heavy chain